MGKKIKIVKLSKDKRRVGSMPLCGYCALKVKRLAGYSAVVNYIFLGTRC